MASKGKGKAKAGAGSSSEGRGSERRTGKIRLSPDPDEGVWFSDSNVVTLVSDTIHFNFTSYCPNWTETPQEMRKLWWNWFKGYVEYDPSLELSVREAWEAAIKPRLRDMVYRASTAGHRPKWMSPEMYELVVKRRTDPAFLKRSKTATENRLSGSGDKGKALGTHTMGRMNAVQAMDSLETIQLIPIHLHSSYWRSLRRQRREAGFHKKRRGFTTNFGLRKLSLKNKKLKG